MLLRLLVLKYREGTIYNGQFTFTKRMKMKSAKYMGIQLTVKERDATYHTDRGYIVIAERNIDFSGVIRD